MRYGMKAIGLILCLLMISPLAAATKSTKRSTSKKKSTPKIDKSYFNPRTIVTITGPVVSVDTEIAKGRPGEIQAVVRNSKETVTVHLAPEWYLARESATIVPNDILRVKGSRTTFKNKPCLVAVEITVKDQITRLRKEDGTPLWDTEIISKRK